MYLRSIRLVSAHIDRRKSVKKTDVPAESRCVERDESTCAVDLRVCQNMFNLLHVKLTVFVREVCEARRLASSSVFLDGGF